MRRVNKNFEKIITHNIEYVTLYGTTVKSSLDFHLCCFLILDLYVQTMQPLLRPNYEMWRSHCVFYAIPSFALFVDSSHKWLNTQVVGSLVVRIRPIRVWLLSQSNLNVKIKGNGKVARSHSLDNNTHSTHELYRTFQSNCRLSNNLLSRCILYSLTLVFDCALLLMGSSIITRHMECQISSLFSRKLSPWCSTSFDIRVFFSIRTV